MSGFYQIEIVTRRFAAQFGDRRINHLISESIPLVQEAWLRQ